MIYCCNSLSKVNHISNIKNVLVSPPRNFFFFSLSLWFGAFGWVGWWAVCMLCCSVPSWSAFRLTTSKVAFSYYLVFPARALSFLFVPVFSCVSWLASCSSIHLTQMPLILMLGMPFYCLIIIYWLYLNVRCFF